MDNGNLPATKNDLRELEQWIDERMLDLEQRIDERLGKRLEALETSLLGGMESLLRQGEARIVRAESRMSSLQTSDDTMNQRIAALDLVSGKSRSSSGSGTGPRPRPR